VSPLPINLYAQWRVRSSPATELHDRVERPPEEWLQRVWHHQRLKRESLRLLDGRRLRVLHPGFRSLEGGPDFRDAVIQIEGDAACAGDLEVDVDAAGWKHHGHDRNPAFAKVVLHVVWNAPTEAAQPLPTLVLSSVLDAPLGEIVAWTEGEPGWADEFLGRCCSPLQALDTERLGELLRQAAQVRLERKAQNFARRARDEGWEQALWEGLFRALGYKHNAWPMQRLAELLPGLAEADRAVASLQARFLGLAGLLPHELPANSLREARPFWDTWWRERDRWRENVLPPVVWRMHGLRPANQPQRRLALAAHWLARPKFVADLEEWFLGSGKPSALLQVLQGGEDDFWEWHWTLRSVRMAKPQPLLGGARATDLAINVVLPWFRARAEAGGNAGLVTRVDALFQRWPAGEDNSKLKQARVRLLGGARRDLKATAALQQGLLQILQDFCGRADALCSGCRFPDLVRGLSPGPGPAVADGRTGGDG
jgi:hypothetical protein